MSDAPRGPGRDELDLGAFSMPTAAPKPAPAHPAPVIAPPPPSPPPAGVRPAEGAPASQRAPVAPSPVARATSIDELPYDEGPLRQRSSRWKLLGPIIAGVVLAVVVVAALAIGRAHRHAGPPSPAGERTATNGTTAVKRGSTTTTTKGTAGATTGGSAATTTAAAPGVSFGDGVHAVPADVKPGRYVSAGGDSCYWARERDTSGTPEAIIANSVDPNAAVVDIAPTDGAFETDGCGRWTTYAAPAQPRTSFGDGTFVVGGQIAPGQYRTTATGSCHWGRLSSFAGTPDAVVASVFADGTTTVAIAASDVGFSTTECGTWTKIG